MAKITALSELSAPADGDFLYIVDVSDTTDDPAGSSRKIPLSSLLPTHFQVRDDGSTGQLTTGSDADLTGIWDTPNTGSGFSWNGTTGVLTVDAASSCVVFDIVVASWNNANNRSEIHLQLQEDTGGGYSTIVEQSSYTTRNNTQDEGQVVLAGFKRFSVAASTNYKVRVRDVGSAATVGASNVAAQTYISVTRYP